MVRLLLPQLIYQLGFSSFPSLIVVIMDERISSSLIRKQDINPDRDLTKKETRLISPLIDLNFACDVTRKQSVVNYIL